MKRYIKSSTIPETTLNQAIKFAEGIKHSTVDLNNHIIIIPFGSTSTEDILMSEGMLGKWFADNGFDIKFSRGDYEYQTQGEFNHRSLTKYKGHKAFLRNRLIATITW